MSQEVRKKYKKHLRPMPQIEYLKIFARNPSTEEAKLGRLLFSDTILSRNNDVSCATCHLTNHGFADGNSLNIGSLGEGGPDGSSVSEKAYKGVLSLNRHFGDDGFGFKQTRFMFRNSLSTVNVGHRINISTDSGLLWDGRFGDIFFQVLLPIHTPEELCGTNPLALSEENIFKEKGPIFDRPVKINHSVFVNPYSGRDEGEPTGRMVTVKGIPKFRKNNQLTIPNRNECLALAIAKLNKNITYKKLFKKIYKTENITEKHLASALAMFVTTHVSKNTKYDKFVKGENLLSKSELYGLGIFVEDYGKKFELNGKRLTGAGCVNCHTPPLFEQDKYYSLGIKSDLASALSKPQFTGNFSSGFFQKPRLQRGRPPKCHIPGKTATTSGNYAPDPGRANADYKDESCFKFRVPSLRNVIATFPYYHHGSERAQSLKSDDPRERARSALKNTIEYHLKGVVDQDLYNRFNFPKKYFDRFFQLDPLIPTYHQNFMIDKTVEFKKDEIEYLLSFVSEGLEDESATKVGDLGNAVTHPRSVPSGLLPTITRDHGHQYELNFIDSD